MKNKVIAALLFLGLATGAIALANDFVHTESTQFIAPSVNGTSNVYSPQVGEIVYDSAAGGFYGYDQSGTWQALGGSSSGNPVGTMIPFAGSSVPGGYLMANGAAVSRTTYANLFAVIGTTYGAGDGSTTFNLPDTRNVFLRGANASARTIGGVSYPAVTLGATTSDILQGHVHPASLKGTTDNATMGYAALNQLNSLELISKPS